MKVINIYSLYGHIITLISDGNSFNTWKQLRKTFWCSCSVCGPLIDIHMERKTFDSIFFSDPALFL